MTPRNNGTPKSALTLLSFRPPSRIQNDLQRRRMAIQPIETGIGPLNLDNYQVEILSPPRWAGADVSSVNLFAFFRKNINLFLERGTCLFAPFSNIDAPVWASDSPAGAVIHIDMYDKKLGNIEDGAVVCAESSSEHWIFSTVDAPGDFSHPVNGNREFGIFEFQGRKIIYSMGADRICGAGAVVSLAETIFSKAHLTWMGMQRNLVAYIQKNGGQARILTSQSMRVDWTEHKARYFHPKTSLVSPGPTTFDVRSMGGKW